MGGEDGGSGVDPEGVGAQEGSGPEGVGGVMKRPGSGRRSGPEEIGHGRDDSNNGSGVPEEAGCPEGPESGSKRGWLRR